MAKTKSSIHREDAARWAAVFDALVQAVVTIDTGGALSPVLAWLATVPLNEVSVEPTGLRPIYEQVHPKVNANCKMQIAKCKSPQ